VDVSEKKRDQKSGDRDVCRSFYFIPSTLNAVNDFSLSQARAETPRGLQIKHCLFSPLPHVPLFMSGIEVNAIHYGVMSE